MSRCLPRAPETETFPLIETPPLMEPGERGSDPRQPSDCKSECGSRKQSERRGDTRIRTLPGLAPGTLLLRPQAPAMVTTSFEPGCTIGSQLSKSHPCISEHSCISAGDLGGHSHPNHKRGHRLLTPGRSHPFILCLKKPKPGNDFPEPRGRSGVEVEHTGP